MTKNKLSEKYNESCIKIFALISMFTEGDAVFSDVIKLFADPDGTIKQKSNVLLNKYLNTLELFGIKVEKNKGKYHLLKMPFSINLSEEELYAVALLKSSLSYLSKGESKDNLEKFLEELEKRYDYDTKQLNQIISTTRNHDLSFYFLKFEKQISNCEKYCKEGNKLEISYLDSDNNEANLICVPLEIKYFDKYVCFSVFNNLTRQIYDIPIDKIRNIHLLRVDANGSKTCTSVIFRLKGDLVKSYKLREWEKSSGIDSDGCLVIENSGEDFDTLTTRLFKYHENCEVLAPKYLKTRLIKMINNTLKNYGL